MSVRSLMVGWNRPAPAGKMTLIQPDEFLTADLGSYGVVVLGDAAITDLDPTTVLERLHRKRLVCLLCPDSGTERDIAPWSRAGFGRLVFPEELSDVLDELGRSPIRPLLRPSDWLPVVPRAGTEAARAIQVVPELARAFSVADWARELGWSRSTLWRMCATSLGAPPREVLWRYVEAVVGWGRQQRLGLTELAAVLGYSDASTLAHAVARRGAPRERRAARGPALEPPKRNARAP